MERRNFLAQLGLGLASCATPRNSHIFLPHNQVQLLNTQSPKAIAMWDFSWLLRQYKGGGFEDWDKVLDELTERGYNALRIDCFPQFISKDSHGIRQERYHLPKSGWHPTLWGNAYTIDIEPEQGLIRFIKKCHDRNIYLVLSTWFYGHGTGRNKNFIGPGGLVDAWDNVLKLLSDNDLLHNILYIDILNEYPLWHGYQWLTEQLTELQNTKARSFDFLNITGKRQYTADQITFYNRFVNDVISELKAKWPGLLFMASQTNTLNTPWQDLDISQFEVLDIHLWLVYNQAFSDYSKYFSHIHTLKNDSQFLSTYLKMKQYWSSHQSALTEWLSAAMEERKLAASRYNIPHGNTEGWGSVMWMDHPDLDWNFIKESGLIAAQLGVDHDYTFNCSSNFTHPHFNLWQDISWHKEVTRTIRKL